MKKYFKSASALCVALAFSGTAYAAIPKEGSVIGNQATATYNYGNEREPKTTTSNLVETVVSKVSGISIESDQTKTVSVGGTVLFQHTLTNTGNGIDSFDLTTSDKNTGNVNFTNLVIYADADQNGIPDSNAAIRFTPSMDSGSSYGILVSASIPNTASNADTENVSVLATSVTDSNVSAENLNTVNVTGNAVIDITKSLSRNSGYSPSSESFSVTLNYTNTGDSIAKNVTLEDVLPAGMEYVSGSAKWSGLQIDLTDSDDGDEGGVSYDSSTNVITAVINSIDPSAIGTLTFDVKIAANQVTGNITNIAEVSYDDGSGTIVGPISSNSASYTVLQNVDIVLTDENSSTDEDGLVNGIVQHENVLQGSTLLFENVIINNGNGSDTFEVYVNDIGTFPEGTTFKFLKSDRFSLLSDSNGDGNPDTGLITPFENNVTSVYVQVTLPDDAKGTENYSFTSSAVSSFDTLQVQFLSNNLSSIIASEVDLTSDLSIMDGASTANGLGFLYLVTSDPFKTEIISPTEDANFMFAVNNVVGPADQYILEASTDSTFSTISLPSGWSASFRNSGITGTIASRDYDYFDVTISVPDNQAPTSEDIYFRVKSEKTGAYDILFNRVTVSSVVDLGLSSDKTGQIYPAGTKVYSNTLKNLGNAVVVDAEVVSSNSEAGWNSVVYFDKNANGIIDDEDVVLTNVSQITQAGLIAGNDYNLLVKVYAPSGAENEAINTTTITVQGLAGDIDSSNNSIVNVTTVMIGDVRLEKTQSLDALCDGVADNSFVSTRITDALPGNCIVYNIKATNIGSLVVTSLYINDSTPSYTTYFDCAESCSATTGPDFSMILKPASGEAGFVAATINELEPKTSVSLKFVVKIDE